MADSVQLPADVLKDIARQIGDRIVEESESAGAAVPATQPTSFSPLDGVNLSTARFKLTETFEVWKFREDAAGELASTREDLVTLMRHTGTYRHQVRLVRAGGETAVAFAQSVPSGQNEHLVRDFYFSPLAARLDEAIRAADNLIPEEAVTRLISLPEFQIEALWFVIAPAPADPQQPRTITTRGVIVVSAPFDFNGQTMTIMDPAAFIRALSVMTRGMGLLL